MHSRWRIWWGLAGAGAAALVVVGVLLGAAPEFRERADQIGSVLGALSALVGLPLSVLAVWALTDRGGSGPAAEMDDQLAELAGGVRNLWEREALDRGLRGKAPMRIGSRVSGRPVGVSLDEVMGLGALRVLRHRFPQDEDGGLVAGWRRLPFRRLVVLGAPGAGKTSAAVLFTCELAEHRAAGEPVPVLLDLSGWRASQERFTVWLRRTLAGQYGLGATASRAERLVRDRQVVAVLDGFDEMPVGERAAAIAALNKLPDLPVVVLSRAEEYEQTVTATGEPLLRALIVELEPLTAAQTARYLPSGQPAAGRWSAVERHLAGSPDGPLARVLSNPLLAYLAWAVYRKPGTDPGEMIALAEEGRLERRLFAGYLPAQYPDDERARRSLGSLARLLERQGSVDFAWWRIGWSAGRRTVVARLVFAVAVTVPFALLGLAFPAGERLVFEALVAVMAVAAFRTDVDAEPVAPRQVRFQGRVFGTSVLAGLALFLPFVMPLFVPLLGEVAVALISLVLTGLAIWRVRVFAGNLVVGVSRLVRAGRRWRSAETPELVPHPPAMAFLLTTGYMLLVRPDLPAGLGAESPARVAAVGLIVLGLAGLTIGVLAGLGTAFVRVAPRDGLWDPRRSVRGDRIALLVPPLLVGAAAAALPFLDAALGVGVFRDEFPPKVWAVSLGVVAVTAVTSLVIFFAGSAWLTYAVVRLWLAARGRLPWRLMPFLAEAARLGVLRRNGAVYQFRHERLRAHLAGVEGGVRRLE